MARMTANKEIAKNLETIYWVSADLRAFYCKIDQNMLCNQRINDAKSILGNMATNSYTRLV